MRRHDVDMVVRTDDIDSATVRRIAVEARVDPRTLVRVAQGDDVRGDAGHRAREALERHRAATAGGPDMMRLEELVHAVATDPMMFSLGLDAFAAAVLAKDPQALDPVDVVSTVTAFDARFGRARAAEEGHVQEHAIGQLIADGPIHLLQAVGIHARRMRRLLRQADEADSVQAAEAKP